MKHLITLLALSISVGTFAQDRVVLNSSDVEVRQASAILVRTAQTPDKVEINFNNIQLMTNVCIETVYVRRTCSTTENVYRTREVCRDVTTTPAPAPGRPTGPNYNPRPVTRRVCTTERYYVGQRQVPYDCSFNECVRSENRPAGVANDKVKIKFKNLPNLGGNEEETFSVTASQNGADNSNIVYSIVPLKTINDRVYEVNKKGIFGYDSYVIEPK
jgi:hypothetical protein